MGTSDSVEFYNTLLLAVDVVDPTKQTPQFLMHSDFLGLTCAMILQFADIHGKAFVVHINNAASNCSRS
jgi:hypothetical protein